MYSKILLLAITDLTLLILLLLLSILLLGVNMTILQSLKHVHKLPKKNSV